MIYNQKSLDDIYIILIFTGLFSLLMLQRLDKKYNIIGNKNWFIYHLFMILYKICYPTKFVLLSKFN